MAFGGMFSGGFRPMFDAGGAVAVAPWWQVAGVTCVGAYAAKGAASYAASKINLANPGTYDAIDGTAYPTWAAATGWTFAAASSQYLRTGITPAATWSALVQFSGAVNAATMLFAASGYSFAIAPWTGNNYHNYYWGADNLVTPPVAAGNLGLAGANGYKNGVLDKASLAGTPTFGLLLIGTRTTGAGFISASVQAFVVYSGTLSAPQVATVSAAMAAL